ncbi:MAG: hypothetical protein KGZ75_04705 [Syntrophomonadaceae bacterium]|nr:hypothetical protein [Syntrophomonadaceae bacterium]
MKHINIANDPFCDDVAPHTGAWVETPVVNANHAATSVFFETYLKLDKAEEEYQQRLPRELKPEEVRYFMEITTFAVLGFCQVAGIGGTRNGNGGLGCRT